ncbi:zinc finger protein [Theobroma cacao]|nr:zinc finger protein [Theobroma cacao]
MSITVLIEFIRDMFQRWFHERYEEAVKVTSPFSPWVAKQLSKRFNDAHRFLVKPINRVEFEVKDGKMDRLVNLSRKTCSCCEFQTDLLPCSHAIAAISKCNREAIEFCADYYKTTIFVDVYSRSIRPVGHLSEWDIPPHVKQIIFLPPPWRGQAGRPRRRRIPSAGEGSRARRCSQISMSRPLSDQDRVKVHSYIVCKNVSNYNLHQTRAMYLLICLKYLATKSPVCLEEKDDEPGNSLMPNWGDMRRPNSYDTPTGSRLMASHAKYLEIYGVTSHDPIVLTR